MNKGDYHGGQDVRDSMYLCIFVLQCLSHAHL